MLAHDTQQSEVNRSVAGFAHYRHERFAHPFLPTAPLWLSSACETTSWLLSHEVKLMRVMNSSLRCTRLFEKRDAIVVDVGTNCGLYTVAAATCGYEVHAFEIQPKCIRMMRTTLAANNVPSDAYHIINQPVSDKAKTLTLPAAPSCSGTFSFSRTDRAARAGGKLNLQASVLADALPPTVEIALLKVDTEGHDPQVLFGALPLFRARRVRLATVEASPFMWTSPHDPALAEAFRQVLLAGYRARCMSKPAVAVSAATVVPMLASGGALAKCVDLVLCRDDTVASEGSFCSSGL
jgi:FkbM family methyltransferase